LHLICKLCVALCVYLNHMLCVVVELCELFLNYVIYVALCVHLTMVDHLFHDLYEY
jgi:hypothetical protein